jgi:hypothetical protein
VSAAKAALTSLHDVRGVQGSFLLLPGGELVARESLPVISDESLGETGRRLSNVFQAIDSVCPGSEEVVLRFDGLALFARRNARAVVAVVVGESASVPALRMASNLVLRQLDTVELAPAASAEAAAPPSPPKAPPTRRFWRGTVISEDE